MTSVSISLDLFNSARGYLKQCDENCMRCSFGFELICPVKKIVEVGMGEGLGLAIRRV